MDIDTLRSVAEASKIKPEEDRRDVEERREARRAAVEARREHTYAMNMYLLEYILMGAHST